MAEWWSALPGIQQFFYTVAFAASLVMVIQLVLSLVGLAHGADADFGGDTGDFGGVDTHLDFGAGADGDHVVSHDAGIGILSVRTIVAFFVGFGWGGVAMYDGTKNAALSLVVAALIGFAFMMIAFWLMNSIFKLREAGNVDYANAIGCSATVYVSIPARREGSGQVQVVVQGRLREVAAVTDEEERLAPGTRVVITRQIDPSTFVVRKSGSE